jgi:hypothetical protein
MTTERLLQEREQAYGDAHESFQRIATLWGDVLGILVTPQQVASCMIMLKVARLLADGDGSHDEDSVLDIKGYTTLRLGELG